MIEPRTIAAMALVIAACGSPRSEPEQSREFGEVCETGLDCRCEDGRCAGVVPLPVTVVWGSADRPIEPLWVGVFLADQFEALDTGVMKTGDAIIHRTIANPSYPQEFAFDDAGAGSLMIAAYVERPGEELAWFGYREFELSAWGRIEYGALDTARDRLRMMMGNLISVDSGDGP
jgi:hypothetical protein